MAGKETVLYSYTPREAAKAFLKDVLPSYIPVEASRRNPSAESSSIADVLGRIIRTEPSRVKMRYLSEQPITFVALLISDVNAGLTPRQERFVLYSSALRYKTQAGIEIKYYEDFGTLLYGNLDTMQDFTDEKPKSNRDYIEEKRNDIIKLEKLMNSLMQRISNSSQSKER